MKYYTDQVEAALTVGKAGDWTVDTPPELVQHDPTIKRFRATSAGWTFLIIEHFTPNGRGHAGTATNSGVIYHLTSDQCRRALSVLETV